MESHWSQASEWDNSQVDSEECAKDIISAETAGSYHCKSALRDHTSNMKLFLYRNDFFKMKNVFGSDGYTDEVLLLLPDLWNCFYNRTHGLDRLECQITGSTHSVGSPAFVRWADLTMKDIVQGDIIRQSLLAEAHIWGKHDDYAVSFVSSIYMPAVSALKRVLYLTYFLNMSLVVLNYKPSDSRPDVIAAIPGVVDDLGEGIHSLTFNDYFQVFTSSNAVRVRTPIYDQIVQKDIYLNLCDKINERLNTMIGCITIQKIPILDGVTGHPDVHLKKAVESIISWGDKALYLHKNRAFDVIGKFEAYCVSAILRDDNPEIWDNLEFQRNLLEDDATNSPHILHHARLLCDILNTLSVTSLSEVHGLWRIWGHPIIDLEGGLVKMEATCTKEICVDRAETKVGERTFKLVLFQNYYKKHRHYPLSNISRQEQFEAYTDNLIDQDKKAFLKDKEQYNELIYLHRCIRNSCPINDRSSSYSHHHWDTVILYQNFQIPHSVNLATMIKDKAISQTRSELVESVVFRNSVFDPTRRRGVLKWLSEQTFKLKDYLLNIDKQGLKEDAQIIGLYPKERELKPKARFFSLMSYDMRMYITATEEIIGKYLLPYFPMITMSDTLLSMIIRLYNMTSTIGGSNTSVTYSMNIDFSKWNQNMREETNSLIFNAIDRFIGFRNLISRTHDIFRRSYIYLCSGEYIPAVIQGCLTTMSPYSRIGDGAGKEGLRQKGWTITTVCDILSLAYSHNVQIELIGGGDNQVLTVTIRTPKSQLKLPQGDQLHNIKKRMLKFRDALAKKMEKRGLPLKLEETWISHRLLMYNKIMYLDGVPLCGRLKVIGRLFSNSNEGISCLGNVCSTLGTGYQSLSAKDYDPILSWILSRWFTLLAMAQYFLFCPMNGTRRMDKAMLLSYANIREDKGVFGCNSDIGGKRLKLLENFRDVRLLSVYDLYMVCIYYHKILGGPGIGTPLSYIMKGFPDPLSEGLHFNYSIMRQAKTQENSIRHTVDRLTAVNKSAVQHWEHLLEDPVSINHDAPPHGVAALRAQAEKVMKQADIKNKCFLELINIGDKEYLRELSDNLCRPFDIEPRLLHDVVGATIPGYVNTVLSKVDQSSTLNKMAADKDVVAEIYINEMLYMIFLAKKINVRSGHMPTSCATQDARMLRNTTWGKNIVGVTTPHPSAYLTLKDHSSSDLTCDQNYIAVFIRRSLPHYVTVRGEFRPYFGSYTQEKFKTSVLASAYGDEDILKRALKIQKLLGWRYKEQDYMYRVIQGILSCITNSSPDKFLPTPEEITGDVEHRYHDMATKHGGIPSNLIKYYTYTSCNTSTFIDHSKGAANESLHFQAAIIYCSMLSILKTNCATITTKMLHYHESCPHCITPIIPIDDTNEVRSNIELRSCPGNELMYIEEKDIPVHYHTVVAFNDSLVKKEKTKRRGHTDINFRSFTTAVERGSWLLLIAASFASSRGLKMSAVSLLLDRMTVQEICLVVTLLMNLHLISAKKTLLGFSLCDVKDLYDTKKEIFDAILAKEKIMLFLIAVGAQGSGKLFTEIMKLSSLMCIDDSDLVESVRTAVCKYQDPEYSASRIMQMTLLNSSLNTCAPCVGCMGGEGSKSSCGIHGTLQEPTSFHLYSLDKLGRFSGPPINQSDDLGDSINKKRKTSSQKFSLFTSIKLYKTGSSSRQIIRRKGNFLYQTPSNYNDICDYMMDLWTRDVVMSDKDDKTDRLSDGIVVGSIPRAYDVLPSVENKVLSLVQQITYVTQDIYSKRSAADLYIEFNIRSVSMKEYIKVIHMLIMINRRYTQTQLNVMFYISDIATLEDDTIKLVQEVVSQVRVFLDPKDKMCFTDVGDSMYNMVSVASSGAYIIGLDASIVQYGITGNCYVLTNMQQVYVTARQIDSIIDSRKMKLKVEICQPRISACFPQPVILKVSCMSYHSQIAESKLLTSLDVHASQLDRTLINLSIMSDARVDDSSLVMDLYRSFVRISTGVVNESTYNTVVSSLATGLREFAMSSCSSEVVPWRCSMLVKMILAIRILASSDYDVHIEHYAKAVGFSFKRGTYKVVLLHFSTPNVTQRARLINWTPGTLGSDLPWIMRELSEALIISWHHSLPVSHKIFI